MGRKLKRFLLRYDPPGIGLEIQEDEELAVVHKDLPPSSQIHGMQDIFTEVDRIISEDDMLTKKRHRPALIQLLGRLYQIDTEGANVNATDDEDHGGSPAHKNDSGNMGSEGKAAPTAAASAASQLLSEGCSVVLTGLEAGNAVHNGEVGILTKCRLEKQKFEVKMLTSQAEVKVKDSAHIILCAPQGTGLTVGCGVVIRGLRNHTELNGCLGRVVECHEETHRFEVRATESGQLFRVKQENLIPIDPSFVPAMAPKAAGPLDSSGAVQGDDDMFEVGSKVELQGLKTAMAFNGQSAEVLCVDRSRQRYEIRLGDGSVKTIRAENVKLISRAPGVKSPRSGHKPRKEGAPKGADRAGK